eukprot:gene20545-27335_t
MKLRTSLTPRISSRAPHRGVASFRSLKSQAVSGRASQVVDDKYVHLKNVLSASEMDELEVVYDRFLAGDLVDPKDMGKDFCDMSGGYDRPLEEFNIMNVMLVSKYYVNEFNIVNVMLPSKNYVNVVLPSKCKPPPSLTPAEFNIVNVMLPSKYYPPLRGNLYEQRAASIAKQLCGPDMAMDYDQLLAKPPNKPDAVFHWHQDLAYWPVTSDTRTASFWLALDEVNVENGCIRFVPGTHLEPSLRPHNPLYGDREKNHTLVAQLKEGDVPVPAEISRGDLTVHSERILHGSGGNLSKNNWRRAFVIAYRSKETVEEERRMGFSHSHNDSLDVLNEVGKE